MPTIYRPETDAQRKQALQRAKTKADAVGVGSLAFSANTLAALNAFLPNFLTALQNRGSALSAQAASTHAMNPTRRVLRLWISHFFQVFNLAVLREEYAESDRAYYQLDVNSSAGPKLTTDEDLVEWAGNLASGETARVTAGGAAGGANMAKPSAAEVAAQYDIFEPLLTAHTSTKDAYDNEQEAVAAMRNQADDIIGDIWDEVLFTYRKDDAPSMRRKARENGVVYISSPGEVPTPDEFSAAGKVSELNANGQGMPMADVEVTLVETNFAVLTDANGNYLMPHQTAGNYNLRFKKEGYTEQTHPITITEGEITELDVQLEPMMPPPMP